MKYSYLLFVTVILCVSCQPTENGLEQEQDKFTKNLIELNKNYDVRFKTNDRKWYEDHYTVDAEVLPDKAPIKIGLDSIMKYYYNDGKNTPDIELKITASNISSAFPYMIEQGNYEIFITDFGTIEKGKFIAIWKQEDKVWKIWREIWNSDDK